MIAKLTGLVDSTGEDWIVVDVSGVGYLVYCSARTLSRVLEGDTVRLHVETHVREDHIHLYGFLERAERDWFRLLTTVQGVGARGALAILGVLTGDDLVWAIASADNEAITRAPGVGPKLASRIVSELKDKVGAVALGPAARTGGAPERGATAASHGHAGVSPAVTEAVSALVNLGYGPSEAMGAVSRASTELGDDAALEALIRAGLAALAPADLAGASGAPGS